MDMKLYLAHWLWLSELTTTTTIGPASPNLPTAPRSNLKLHTMTNFITVQDFKSPHFVPVVWPWASTMIYCCDKKIIYFCFRSWPKLTRSYCTTWQTDMRTMCQVKIQRKARRGRCSSASSVPPPLTGSWVSTDISTLTRQEAWKWRRSFNNLFPRVRLSHAVSLGAPLHCQAWKLFGSIWLSTSTTPLFSHCNWKVDNWFNICHHESWPNNILRMCHQGRQPPVWVSSVWVEVWP